MLEVQEEAVGAGTGGRRGEGDLRTGLGAAVAGLPVGVDVQVGEVTGTQRDEVSVGGEVGLEVGDRAAAPADVEPEVFRGAGAERPVEGHGVAVDRGGAGRLGELGGLVGAGYGEIGAESEVGGVLRAGGEVREDPVVTGGSEGDGGAPGAVGSPGGVQMPIGGQVP